MRFWIDICDEDFDVIGLPLRGSFRPLFAVMVGPRRNLFERVQPGFAVAFPSLLLDVDETAFGQYFDVFVNGGATYLKVFGDRMNV